MTSLSLRCLLLAALLAITPSVLAQQQPLVRINAGGDEVTAEGITFSSDSFFSTSKTSQSPGSPVSGTSNLELYQSDRISNDASDPYEYKIPVPQAGNYTVRLHFAETFFTDSGKRVFDVEVEGDMVLEDYDIFVAASGANNAVVENIPNVTVTDDTLNIVFMANVERAKVNGIEVLGTVTPKDIPFYMNAGGTAYTDGDITWVTDDGSYFLEGTAFTKTVDIPNSDDDPLYAAERFSNTLRFLLPGMLAGEYTIELHFAETFHTTAGQRVFDVFIEGENVLDDYDIFAQAGGKDLAKIEIFEQVEVSDGLLNITLERTAGSATINAIAITAVSLVSNEPLEEALPAAHTLSSVYPNPFRNEAAFTLSVDQTQHVSIRVFDVLGREVTTVHDGMLPARQIQQFRLEAGELVSGIYLVQVTGERFAETQQVVLIH